MSRLQLVDVFGLAEHLTQIYRNIITIIHDRLGVLSRLFADIATRPDSHLEIARFSASAGCDVLCQKPIAPNWKDSKKLVKACEDVRLMINENWRWQPWYQKIRELIDSGVIGEIHTVTILRHEDDALRDPPFPDQPYFLEMEPFLLIESVIHQIDVTRFLGGSIREVFCDTRRVSGVTEGEDSVTVHLKLEGGKRGMIYSTRASEPDVEDPLCDYARIEGMAGFIRLERDGTITVKSLFESDYEVDYEVPKRGYRGASCEMAQKSFVNSIISGDRFETPGENYLDQVMKTVFAGYESSKQRKAIRLEKWE